MINKDSRLSEENQNQENSNNIISQNNLSTPNENSSNINAKIEIRGKRPSRENPLCLEVRNNNENNTNNNNDLSKIEEATESSLYFNSLEMKSWKENNLMNNDQSGYNLILETKTKVNGLVFTEEVSKSLLNEMKLHFKLLLKCPYPDEFYKQIERKEFNTIIGLDKETKEPAGFAVTQLLTNTKLTTSLETNGKDEGRNCCCLNKVPKKKIVILAIAVIREFQRQGVGSSIIEKIEKDSQSLNIHSIELIVQSLNYPAINFYKKHGFKTSKILDEYYNFDSPEENKALLMVKKLINNKNNCPSFFTRLKEIILCRNKENIEYDTDDEEN